MELFKLTDDELTNLCNMQEKITDKVIPDFLSMININITTKIKDESEIDDKIMDYISGDEQPIIIPQIELISYYVTPIFEMEREMKKRGILEEYRSKTPFIDYEHQKLLVYNQFEDRIAHLFNMHENGILTDYNISKSIEAVYSNVVGHTNKNNLS